MAQLHSIHDYIAQDSALYAKRVSAALVQKTMGLDEMPRLGRMVRELNNDTVRELPLYSYRIVYQIKPDHIAVLAVLHKRQDVQGEDIPREK